jgi:hypothetical protein
MLESERASLSCCAHMLGIARFFPCVSLVARASWATEGIYQAGQRLPAGSRRYERGVQTASWLCGRPTEAGWKPALRAGHPGY